MQLLAASDNDLGDHPTHHISLSASGLSFHGSEELAQGATLEVKLLMFPSYVCVLAFGSVVHCRATVGGAGAAYQIGVDFTHVREADRELIARHVTQKQSAVLREARMACEEG